MKKISLSILFILSFAFIADGQTFSKYALGLRFGYNLEPYVGGYRELSYQLITSNTNRIEIDLGILGYEDRKVSINVYRLVGIYQWGNRLHEGFGWYTGIGAGLGIHIEHSKYGFFIGNEGDGDLILAAQAGIQYRFIGFPFLIALDFRPEYNTNSEWMNNQLGNIAFSTRFTF